MNKKILVIDDDAEIRKYFDRLLTAMGYVVKLAETGDIGYTMAADTSINMIIIDLVMPGKLIKMELVNAMRELRPDCPIVIITGYYSEDLNNTAEKNGFEILFKPISLAQIRNVVRKYL